MTPDTIRLGLSLAALLMSAVNVALGLTIMVADLYLARPLADRKAVVTAARYVIAVEVATVALILALAVVNHAAIAAPM